MSENLLEKLTAAIKAGKRKDAKAATEELLEAGTPPGEILDALISGMDDVGRRFKANEIFVPEVLVSARAMNTSMQMLEPELVKAGLEPEHTVVIGTVEGDLHDIGKNLVGMMLKGANFKVVDLGTNVGADAFVEKVKETGAEVIALSSLLTTTMPAMKETVARIREAGLPAKILVGGAPVTAEYAEQIQADGYGDDAASAVEEARKLLTV